MLRAVVSAFALTVAALPSHVLAQQAEQTTRAVSVDALVDAMMIDEIVAVQRDEGLKNGIALEEELFAGRGGDRWTQTLERIYDPKRAEEDFAAALSQELEGAEPQIAEMLAFLGSDQGRQIVRLEIEARRALMDDAAEDSARLRLEEMTAQNDPRLQELHRFAEVNQLVEMNVAGALNTNLAFYRGMAAAGALDGMPEGDMLADVWAQEDTVRSEIEDWLFPYLALAYGPVADADLRDYIAFSESGAGQLLNTAVFAAFDKVFARISFDMGEAAGLMMQGQDI